MSAKGTYKIGDLGFSRLMNTLHGEDVPEGDSWYLALELLSNDPNAELPDLKKADVFAFGILLFELIEGWRVASNGDEWHMLRNNNVKFTNYEVDP